MQPVRLQTYVIRSALRRQLGYLEQFMSDGYAMTGKDIGLYLTIIRL